MKTFLIAALAALAFNANAVTYNENTNPALDSTFLDVGLSHWDTSTDLEWLNFSDLVEGPLTLGMSVNDAEAWYGTQGWELASYDQVYNLFDTFFEPDFDATGTTPTGTMLVPEGDGSATLIQSRNSWLLDFGTDATSILGSADPTDALLYSTGMYLDAAGVVQVMGVKFDTVNLTTTIYGPDYDFPLALDRDTEYSNLGTFMVQAHVVPIPAAVWLFGTGLLGLVAVARRKHK